MPTLSSKREHPNSRKEGQEKEAIEEDVSSESEESQSLHRLDKSKVDSNMYTNRTENPTVDYSLQGTNVKSEGKPTGDTKMLSILTSPKKKEELKSSKVSKPSFASSAKVKSPSRNPRLNREGACHRRPGRRATTAT